MSIRMPFIFIRFVRKILHKPFVLRNNTIFCG